MFPKKHHCAESGMRYYSDKEINHKIIQCFFAFITAIFGYSLVGFILVFMALKIYYRFF